MNYLEHEYDEKAQWLEGRLRATIPILEWHVTHFSDASSYAQGHRLLTVTCNVTVNSVPFIWQFEAQMDWAIDPSRDYPHWLAYSMWRELADIIAKWRYKP